jgi:hypothetical protein
MPHVVHQQGRRRLGRLSGRLPKPIPGYSGIPALAAVRNVYILIGQGPGHAQSNARH